MNQSQTSTIHSISINSNHFINHLDTIIIQLSNIISVEKSIDTDKSIDITRKILLKKSFELIPTELKTNIMNAFKILETEIMKDNKNSNLRSYYSAFRILMGIE